MQETDIIPNLNANTNWLCIHLYLLLLLLSLTIVTGQGALVITKLLTLPSNILFMRLKF